MKAPVISPPDFAGWQPAAASWSGIHKTIPQITNLLTSCYARTYDMLLWLCSCSFVYMTLYVMPEKIMANYMHIGSTIHKQPLHQGNLRHQSSHNQARAVPKKTVFNVWNGYHNTLRLLATIDIKTHSNVRSQQGQ